MKQTLIAIVLVLSSLTASADIENTVTGEGGAGISDTSGGFCHVSDGALTNGLNLAKQKAVLDSQEKCAGPSERISEYEITQHCVYRGSFLVIKATAEFRCLEN